MDLPLCSKLCSSLHESGIFIVSKFSIAYLECSPCPIIIPNVFSYSKLNNYIVNNKIIKTNNVPQSFHAIDCQNSDLVIYTDRSAPDKH